MLEAAFLVVDQRLLERSVTVAVRFVSAIVVHSAVVGQNLAQ